MSFVMHPGLCGTLFLAFFWWTVVVAWGQDQGLVGERNMTEVTQAQDWSSPRLMILMFASSWQRACNQDPLKDTRHSLSKLSTIVAKQFFQRILPQG